MPGEGTLRSAERLFDWKGGRKREVNAESSERVLLLNRVKNGQPPSGEFVENALSTA